MVNTNAFPYYDDFDANKNFHKILFHPARPVQARELTQIQSIIQEQIKKQGDHMFKNGTMVIPGHVYYDEKVIFLKIESVYNGVDADSNLSLLIGNKIIGDTSGVEAIIVHADNKVVSGATISPTTLYIKYTASNGSVQTFLVGETLSVPSLPAMVLKIQQIDTFTGNSSVFTINDGVYYVNGYYVGVSKQTISVSKYGEIVNAVVGLDVVETIVTENEDASLYDNAAGFTNYGAPGSHRLKLSLSLSVKPLDYTIIDLGSLQFVDLLKIKEGQMQYLNNETKYAELEKILAKRTFEESGNYVTKPFTFKSIDYRDNDRGQWVASSPYLVGDIVSNAGSSYVAVNTGYSGNSAPTHSYGVSSDGVLYWMQTSDARLYHNRGQFKTTSTDLAVHKADEAQFVIITSPGKAYVNGMGVEFMSPSYSVAPKARELTQVSGAQLYTPIGSYVICTNISKLPSINSNLINVELRDVSNTKIGTAWIRSIEYHQGSLSTPALVEYKVFLFKIEMNTGKTFIHDVHSMYDITFSAVCKPYAMQISGVATTTGTTVNATGSAFGFDLVVGDRVLIGTTWGSVVSIVSATQFISSVSHAATNANIYVGTTVKYNLGPYVVPVGDKVLHSMRSSSGSLDAQYVVNKTTTFTAGVGTGGITQVTLPSLTNGETYMPSGHIVVSQTTGLPIDATYTLNGNSTQITIGVPESTSYKSILLVRRSGAFAREKTKTLTTKTITLTNSGVYDENGVLLNTVNKYDSSLIYLTEADCVRVLKVTLSGSPSNKTVYDATGETDISSNYFNFDNGQTEEYYGIGKIYAREPQNRPIKITFDYFQHSDGDYFSVDSYSNVPRSSWPAPINVNGSLKHLTNCLDFRSRISDDGLSFNGVGASISEPLHSAHTISTSYLYYSERYDNLVLTSAGEFVYNVNKQASINDMLICDVYVSPYTYDAETEVVLFDKQTRTYTMDALSKIESRVRNVEQFVALNELEKSTLAVSVKDEFGLDRTKNGIIVDDFKTLSIADDKADLQCTLDIQNGILRAKASMDVIELSEPAGMNDATRFDKHYQVIGQQATLPYVEMSLIKQAAATTPETIQSFVLTDYRGDLQVYPNTDIWTDSVSLATNTQAADVIQTNNLSVDVYIPKAVLDSSVTTNLSNLNSAVGTLQNQVYKIMNPPPPPPPIYTPPSNSCE